MNKEQVRSKNLRLLKWDRTKEIEATLQADQALKHISESLLTKKKKGKKSAQWWRGVGSDWMEWGDKKQWWKGGKNREKERRCYSYSPVSSSLVCF